MAAAKKKKTTKSKPAAKSAVKQRGRPFEKGKSGNPNGRPKKSKAQKEFEALCKQHSQEAFDTIYSIMRNPKKASKDRITCAKTILEYAYGKPKQVQVLETQKGGGGFRLVAEIDPRCKQSESD